MFTNNICLDNHHYLLTKSALFHLTIFFLISPAAQPPTRPQVADPDGSPPAPIDELVASAPGADARKFFCQ